MDVDGVGAKVRCAASGVVVWLDARGHNSGVVSGHRQLLVRLLLAVVLLVPTEG